MTVNQLEWMETMLLEHCPWIKKLKVNGYDQMTPQKWVRDWISWGYPKEFFWVIGGEKPLGLTVLRPISSEMIEWITDDYFGTILEYDPRGKIVVIDFAYCPGHYDLLYDLVSATRRPLVAWQHRDKIHVEPIEKIPRIAARS